MPKDLTMPIGKHPIVVSALCALFLTACPNEPDAPDQPDPGQADAAQSDAGQTDSGQTDAGHADGGQTDAGQTDAGQTDAGRTDGGQTDAGRTDAGPDGGAASDGGGWTAAMPAEPAPPALPASVESMDGSVAPAVLTPCPSGWTVLPSLPGTPAVMTGYQTCTPFPSDAPATCPAGQAHFVGRAGCAPLGRPCTNDRWPDLGLFAGQVRYVDGSRGSSGLGLTKAGAFKTIQEGLDAVPSGGIVAVAKGTYDEVLALPNGVTLRGACAAETIVAPTSNGGRSTYQGVLAIFNANSGVTVEDVTIQASGTTLVGVSGFMGQMPTLTGVVIQGAFGSGVYLESGAAFTGTEILVTATRNDGDLSGSALTAALGATATVTRASFVDSSLAGVLATDANTVVSLTDVAVLETKAASDGTDGIGVAALNGARLTGNRVFLDHNRFAGALARGAGSELVLTSSVSQRTFGAPSGDGMGLLVREGASATVNATVFDRNTGAAMGLSDANSVITATDVALLSTAPTASGAFGVGLLVLAGARAVLTRAVADGNQQAGILGANEGTVVEVTDTAVLRTKEGQDPIGGVGAVQSVLGARVEVLRAILEQNEATSFFTATAELMLTDVLVRDTLPGPSDLGAGLYATLAGSLTATRTTVERSRSTGVVADRDATVNLTDVVVRGTRPSIADRLGWGIGVDEGATLSAQRVLLEDNVQAGLMMLGEGTTVTASDLTVTGTLPASNGRGGAAIVAALRSSATITRAAVTGNHEVSVLSANIGTSLTVTDLTVTETLSSTDGTRGWGASVQGGASLVMTRAALGGSRDFGVLAFGSTLTLTDVRVDGVAPMPCVANDTCPEGRAWESGSGLAVLDSSSVTTSRVRVANAQQCGILVSPTSTGNASGLVLNVSETGASGSAIGLCDQVGDLGLQPVLYLDPTNGVLYRSTSFTVPTTADFL